MKPGLKESEIAFDGRLKQRVKVDMLLQQIETPEHNMVALFHQLCTQVRSLPDNGSAPRLVKKDDAGEWTLRFLLYEPTSMMNRAEEPEEDLVPRYSPSLTAHWTFTPTSGDTRRFYEYVRERDFKDSKVDQKRIQGTLTLLGQSLETYLDGSESTLQAS